MSMNPLQLLSCGSDSKESACNVGDLGLIPGLGRSPGEGNGNPLQYSCLENSMDRGTARLQSMGLQSRLRLSDYTFTFHIKCKSHACLYLELLSQYLSTLGTWMYEWRCFSAISSEECLWSTLSPPPVRGTSSLPSQSIPPPNQTHSTVVVWVSRGKHSVEFL